MSTEMAGDLINAVGTILAAVVAVILPVLFKRIQKSDEKIDTLSFLVSYMLTKPEKDHLRRIASRERFMVRTTDNFDAFRDEIRHLSNLGFINYNTQGKPDLFRSGGPIERYVDEYYEIRGPGREYLKLVDQIAKK